jgi:mono/diheme cytochrome c family protein
MRRGGSFLVALSLSTVALASCAQEEYPASLWEAQHPDSGTASAAPGVEPPALLACWQARAESLPARLVAMSANAAHSAAPILVSDIFQRFVEVCGSCHGPSVDPPGYGGFQIVRDSAFSSLMTTSVLEHVTASVCPSTKTSADPDEPMPPCSSPNGATYAERSETDPVKQFGEIVSAWLAAGSPNSYTPSSSLPPEDAGPPTVEAGPSTGDDAGGVSPFMMSPGQGDGLTNIGNCIPSPALMAVFDPKGVALDAMFASLRAQSSGSAVQMIGLPEHLADTDLYTLDSDALARDGVVAYAPGYPLWSDDAGKLRYVRVPRGQSIHFDKVTQQFEIPPNTRFYKTFMKQIIDTDGSYRYRKIETRLIVSRPDRNNADGTAAAQTALFGSYKWNDDESDAVLVETPLNDGKPFADTVFLYNTDEQLAADILRAQPLDPEEALLEGGAARHYAIPSSDRCVQCHMGSPSQAFVLGFTPLQINRRPTGTGGTIEATGADELTQLQRFIGYGLVTGIGSSADVLPLEQSQGSRSPRNDYELIAQGYMLGNCAHCHNPRGYPTVQNPVLTDVLNFLPGPQGGIFQFPLERYSPRIGRGPTGTSPIPYITPSLMDLPRVDLTTQLPAVDVFASIVGKNDTDDQGNPLLNYIAYAPWRSIIYRNVDSAFAYSDDQALYPHMPMNTPGYDPRAKQIVSDWMVSIPSIRKNPDIAEYSFYAGGTPPAVGTLGPPDPAFQPYVEVGPGDPRYAGAVDAAQARLAILHSGTNPVYAPGPNGQAYSRYSDPGNTSDILDPQVLANPVCQPIPVSGVQSPPLPLPIVEHPHWVTTDLSQPSGPYSPRRADWASVLVGENVPAAGQGCTGTSGQAAAHADEVNVVGLVQTATLDQVRSFATTPLPLGLWKANPACDFSSVPTVQSFTGAQRLHWMDSSTPPPAADAPVYVETPGAEVFKMICINCHGPLADSNGRMAQNLATMTGGLARVADFRDGLFGPVGASESGNNRALVFGSTSLPPDAAPNWTGVTDDDRAARYMAWMALGGTEVTIPSSILTIISATQVLGVARQVGAGSANMLSEAKQLCLSLMGPVSKAVTFAFEPDHGYLDLPPGLNQKLIGSNGDGEVWLNMCAMNNPPPVHVLEATSAGPEVESAFDSSGLAVKSANVISPAVYPANTPVGNERGGVDSSLQATNLWPWCVDDFDGQGLFGPLNAAQLAWVSANNPPLCPPEVRTTAIACQNSTPGANCFGNDDANLWAVHGAMNAGFSVFLYVESLENSAGPAPDYAQCP